MRLQVSLARVLAFDAEADLLRHWLGRHTKPSIVGHPDTFVIFRPDLMTMVDVLLHFAGYYIVFVVVVNAFWHKSAAA